MTSDVDVSEQLRLRTGVVIAGGGPAGMMLGFLLARAGIEVTILEKHADFLRDFRGDTIHPSTLEVLHELGLLELFLQRPHNQTQQLTAQVGQVTLTIADFSHLPTTCKFLAFMPQWDFLNFIAEQSRRYANFSLQLQAEATELLEEDGRISGLRAATPSGPLEIVADLVVGADGRASTIRKLAGLTVRDIGAPMDVLWMRIPHHPGDPENSLGRVDQGRIFVMIDRETYWQCAYVIPNGTVEGIQERGLEAFRQDIATLVPLLAERLGALASWDDVKLLTVRVDRLERWHRPGLLCIGDAAHAMSPIGGVGINLAIQDAIAAANLLAPTLRHGPPTNDDLAAVQRRREFPARVTQGLQVLIQNNVIRRVLGGSTIGTKLPLPLRLLQWWPALRWLPAYALGIGVRPEHADPIFRAPAGTPRQP